MTVAGISDFALSQVPKCEGPGAPAIFVPSRPGGVDSLTTVLLFAEAVDDAAGEAWTALDS